MWVYMYNLFSKEMEEDITEIIKRVLRENESTYFGKLFRLIF